MPHDDVEYECEECGATINQDDNFCPKCGVEFLSDEPIDQNNSLSLSDGFCFPLSVSDDLDMEIKGGDLALTKESDSDKILTALEIELVKIREDWFDIWLQGARKTGHKTGKSELGGKAETAIKAFQMFLAVDFIEKQKYIEQQELILFSVFLLNMIFKGESISKIRKHAQLVEFYDDDRINGANSFSIDVAEYISREKTDYRLSQKIMSTMQIFTLHIFMAVANCFRDKKTADSCASEIEFIANSCKY